MVRDKRYSYFRSVALLVVLFLLAACDTPANEVIPLGSPISVITPLTIANDPNDIYADHRNQFVPDDSWQRSEQDGLQIYTSGFYCVPHENMPFFFLRGFNEIPHQSLVLTMHKKSYDASEVQQTLDYFQQVQDHLRDFVDWVPPEPPSTLHWLPGGKQCGAVMQITNTRTSPVELDSFGLQLIRVPVVNTNTYDLADFCPQSQRCLGGIGGPVDCYYTADLVLHANSNDVSFQDKIRAQADCPKVLIVPANQTTEIIVTVKDAQASSLLYQIQPYITLSIAGQEIKTVFSDLKDNLYFTSTDDFPCYALKGYTFIAQAKVDSFCQ